jgi:hypothetical protein
VETSRRCIQMLAPAAWPGAWWYAVPSVDTEQKHRSQVTDHRSLNSTAEKRMSQQYGTSAVEPSHSVLSLKYV